MFSSKVEQRQQAIGMLRAHLARRDRMGNLSRFTVHIVKASFGVAPLNQIFLCQSFKLCLGPMTFQVVVEENHPQFTPFTIQKKTSTAEEAVGRGIVVRYTCKASSLSDLGVGSLHHVPSQVSATVALMGISKFLGPSSPSSLIKGSKNVQLSNQNFAILSSPTLQVMKSLPCISKRPTVRE